MAVPWETLTTPEAVDVCMSVVKLFVHRIYHKRNVPAASSKSQAHDVAHPESSGQSGLTSVDFMNEWALKTTAEKSQRRWPERECMCGLRETRRHAAGNRGSHGNTVHPGPSCRAQATR